MVERGGSDRGLTLVEPQEVAIDLARVQPFALGALQIRPAILEVAANGQHETLEPRVMQVLVALASQKDEVVSRDRLVQRCWSGRAVSEDAINRSIAKLRRLAESRGEFSIETIPRVGFRLTCPECATTPDPIATAEPQLRRRPRGRVILPICIAAVVALAALGRFVQHHETPEGTPPTVALQPFTGLNGDPEAQASAASIAARFPLPFRTLAFRSCPSPRNGAQILRRAIHCEGQCGAKVRCSRQRSEWSSQALG